MDTTSYGPPLLVKPRVHKLVLELMKMGIFICAEPFRYVLSQFRREVQLVGFDIAAFVGIPDAGPRKHAVNDQVADCHFVGLKNLWSITPSLVRPISNTPVLIPSAPGIWYIVYPLALGMGFVARIASSKV